MIAELKTQNERMNKVTIALKRDGWKDLGKVEHPIKYPDCQQFKKCDKKIFVAPAVENYRCVTVWSLDNCLCVVNTLSMKVVNMRNPDWGDTWLDMTKFVNELPTL